VRAAHFDDLIIGGVMLAPILAYAGLALLIMLALRPLLRRIGFTRAFASPPIAEFSLLVSIFALLTLLA
jgi:hypothetical protein